MRFDPVSLNVLADDGAPLGHVIDAIRNGTVDASEAKAKLDLAWIEREEVHTLALSRSEEEKQIAIDRLMRELDDCRKEYVAGDMPNG